MAAAEKVYKRYNLGEQPDETRNSPDDIEKKALWLKTKLIEGPIDGPSSLKTYREDIRQILFKEFNSPISDLEIGVVVRRAFPRHSRKGKYYFGIGVFNANDADETCRKITTDNPKLLMTVQSDGESRDSSPVMLKPVKKRAIQEWRETENGQAFAADQMIRDANSQVSAPVVSVAPSDGRIQPPWQPMLMLPRRHHLPPQTMLFPTATLPGAIALPHPIMVTSEPNNNINRSLGPSRARKRNMDVGAFQKMAYGGERVGKKPRKEGAMIELSSTHNGLIAERTNLASMRIQPIILNFDVPPPKLPLSSPASASNPLDRDTSNETFAVERQKKSKELSGAADGRMDMVSASPRAAESAESSQSKQENSSNKSLLVPSSDPRNSPGSKKLPGEQSLQAAGSKSNHPFKKPDIDSYRTNVSAGRCLMCQNPIPPNASKDGSPQESAILTICMKCKKVAMSGSKSLKPVPKFPYACNPKLAPRTVYVPPPRRIFRPKPPLPTGPQKAVGIRLYPPRSRSKSSSSQRSTDTPVQSPSAPPRSPSQMSMPGSPAPSLPLGSPQPMSPALIMHSAPPSPRNASDAGIKMTSLSLPPSPSMISQPHPSSPAAPDSREPDTPRRLLTSALLQVPSPYSSCPSTPGGRDSSSSERLSLPPGREQDDATIKALLQLGRGIDRPLSDHSTDSTPVSSPINRLSDRDFVLTPYPTGSIPIPHSSVSFPQIAMPNSIPLLAGQVPMIPSNAGVVMGPEGQLLPIVPSWPPMGLPTSEALNMMSQGGYPPMSLFIPQPLTSESSSPAVSVPTPYPVTGIRSRSLLEPAKTTAGPTPDSHSYDMPALKYRKGLKKPRISERMTDSPRAEQSHEDKSKQSIVIVGTNCAGSSSIKLNNDSKEASYHQEDVPREATEMYGKPFSAFCCRCSGREIMLLQCTDCDFVCNNKFGMELHIAAQRHAESRNKSSLPEVMTRHTNEADDRDEVASQSSVETLSADTDTDAASPPPQRVPREVLWSQLPESTTKHPLPAWHETLTSRTGRASFVTASTYGNFGTVTENTVPLDLSGRAFQATPYLPGLPPASFQLREHRKDSSVEESSPLDLSGYSRLPIMSTTEGGSMQQFLSYRKLGTQGSVTAKKTPLDLISSQQPVTFPNIVLTSTSSTKAPKPPPPQTFFDLMRLHNMPIPSTAMTSTPNSSKSLQSPVSSKLPTVRPLTGPVSFSVARTLENPSSPKSYPNIPSIVLSSSTSTSPSLPKGSPYPTTELTRPPPGIIGSPILTQPQSLNYQGGTICVRPTISVPQMHVSSKTVPVLSPFPLPVPVLASATDTRSSTGRQFTYMDSLNVNVGSPVLNQGSPSRGSPTVRESPKVRHRYSTPESPREYSSRKDPSPVRSPQQVHIKVEPPDLLREADCGRRGQDYNEQRWYEEAKEQSRLLDASLITGVPSPICGAGLINTNKIGRTSWGISSKSLQIRDNVFVNVMPSFPMLPQLVSDRLLLGSSRGRDSHNGAWVSPGVQRTNPPDREVPEAPTISPAVDNHTEQSRESSQHAEESDPSTHHITSDSSCLSTTRWDTGSESHEDRGDTTDLITEAVSPTALHIKVEK